MKTRTKLFAAAAITSGVVTFGLAMNVATAGAPPAQPYRQPTPIPAKPHAVGPVFSGEGAPTDPFHPASLGWPTTNTWSIP